MISKIYQSTEEQRVDCNRIHAVELQASPGQEIRHIVSHELFFKLGRGFGLTNREAAFINGSCNLEEGSKDDNTRDRQLDKEIIESYDTMNKLISAEAYHRAFRQMALLATHRTDNTTIVEMKLLRIARCNGWFHGRLDINQFVDQCQCQFNMVR